MTTSTAGIQIAAGDSAASRAWSATVELLSSMRFAISLLTVICIASVIGTVLKQNEPPINYINQFGPFWAQLFQTLSLPTVYSAWWFLLMLAFLVVSTSLCIARNAPKIWVDLRNFKENLRAQSLQAFGHKAEGMVSGDPQSAAQRIGAQLVRSGWRVKLQVREADAKNPAGVMIAAKKGAANKLGYIAAHTSIVLVCIGGLLDGDLFTRMQIWFNGKQVFSGGGLIADVPAQHRLSPKHPAFRGNLFVSEGTASSTAILNQSGGVLIQDLPFSVELKKFIVEYYSTGMPKLFASDIVIHDKETGEKKAARVEVNQPAYHRGVAIYQSSFDDGGSQVRLRALPLVAGTKPFDVQGTIGGSTELSNGAEKLALEFSALRVINVENLSKPGESATDVRAVDVQGATPRPIDVRGGTFDAIEKRLGAGNKVVNQKELRNVGPSIQYKLRDAAGQAIEYHNYMLPVDLGDGVPVFLLGLREKPQEPFRYLRAPADEDGSLAGFARLRAALADPKLRAQAVASYVKRSVSTTEAEVIRSFSRSALLALDLFASVEQPGTATSAPLSGLQAIAEFIERNVPEKEREETSETLVRVLNGVIFELNQIARAKAGLKPLAFEQDTTRAFMTQAILALSDATLYPAPLVFALTGFDQVQASVFQVARTPGKWVVYIGCLFLIIGVFAMLYVRDQRLWVWLRAADSPATNSAAQSHAQIAFSSNRKIIEVDREFDDLQRGLLQPIGSTA